MLFLLLFLGTWIDSVGAVSPAISLGYISWQCNDTVAEVAKQRGLTVDGVYFQTVFEKLLY
jgi:hypothetical protein